jgi:hypothetical protein
MYCFRCLALELCLKSPIESPCNTIAAAEARVPALYLSWDHLPRVLMLPRYAAMYFRLHSSAQSEPKQWGASGMMLKLA